MSVTPLMNAAALGHYETVKILLASISRANVQSSEGITALIHASLDRHFFFVQAPDPSILDKQNLFCSTTPARCTRTVALLGAQIRKPQPLSPLASCS